MATDSSGATLLVKCKLSSAGFPISNPLDNSTVFIPHVNANYRLVIYPTEADANANNTASALVNIPDVEPMTGNTVTTSTGTQTIATALDDRVIRVTSIADMEAYSAPVGYVFSLNAGGRSGVFDVVAGDFSAELAADTLNGVYVGLADDPTATAKVAKRRGITTSGMLLDWFGALGNGSDDRASIVAAIALGNTLFYSDADGTGSTITGSPGKSYSFSGRLQMLPGTQINFGRGSASASLDILDTTGGVDMCGASSFVGEILAVSSTFTGPALRLDAALAQAAGRTFGRGRRICRLDAGILASRQSGSQGLVISDFEGANGGVSFNEGKVDIDECDYGATFEVDNNGYVNSNTFQLVIYDSIEYVRHIVNTSGEISSNKLDIVTQTGADGRTGIALRSDGTANDIYMKVWDWSADKIDSAYAGTSVLFTEASGANLLRGFVGRSISFTQDPIIDLSPSIRRNIISASSSRQPSPMSRSVVPGIKRMVGDQNDILAFADKRYTVTTGGTNPPSAAELESLFRPAFNLLSVSNVTNFAVTVDFGSLIQSTEMSAIGLEFAENSNDRPDRVKIETSTDDVTYGTVMDAGYSGEPVQKDVLRIDGSGLIDTRYLRLTVENDSARRVRISRFYCYASRFQDEQFYGAWAPIFEPTFYGQLKIADGGTKGLSIEGTRVVRERLPAVANAASGTEIATINEILSRLRNHGLID